MATQGILRSGSFWKVGNGVRINIWEDHWTSTKLYRSPLSGSLELVNDLIDGDTLQWKTNLVQATFLPHEGAAILAIPLRSETTTNSLIWKHTKNGDYLLQTGYHLQDQGLGHTDRAEGSNSHFTRRIWKLLWSLRIPRNASIFYGERA